MMIGVISYLPDDDYLRNIRVNSAKTQIEWLLNTFKYHEITVIAQNYTDDDYVLNPFVNYTKYDKGIGPASARNIILNLFYKSEYDWLFLCDDDTTAFDYYNYKDFIYDVECNPSKFNGIDAISAVEPEYHPFKKQNYEDQMNLTHYKFEPRELNSGSATSIMRNLKKYYNYELYFPDIDANNGEGREDMEFLMLWLKNGHTWYTMDTWIRKSLCFHKSSVFGADIKKRDEILLKDLDVICDKYKDDGIQRVNGKITWKNFNHKYNKSKKLLYIPRAFPIEFTEKEKPKPKNTSARRLF